MIRGERAADETSGASASGPWSVRSEDEMVRQLLGTKEQQLIEAEGDQESTRLIVVSIMLGFVSLVNIGLIRFDKLVVNDIICQALFVTSFVFTVGLNIHHYFMPKLAHERVVIGLIHDVAVTTAFLLFSREKFASLLFIYPWITIGHGFRFGEKYLFVASLFTSFGLLVLFKVSAYWSQLAPTGFDLGMIFVLTASYTGYLLRDLSAIKEALKALATRDPLTGLANRRIIEDQLPVLVDENRNENQPMGIIYFDLDGFKPVNDTLGHEVGDVLLKQIAITLKKTVRSDDLVARVGGDEFVIVLKRISTETDLASRAKSILKAIESIKVLNGQNIDISASMGCLFVGTRTPKEWSSSQKLIREADRLMYASKQAGRGMLSMAKTDDLWTYSASA